MGRSAARVFALVMSTPMALLAYNPVHALASTASRCDGHAVTMTVTSHSPHTVHGTSHRDVIVIKSAGHVVDAGGGNDIICGSGGHDVINGGGGNDVVFAAGGNDVVNGGAGSDDLNGGSGNDHLNGGGGNDVENGGGGDDTITGGTGDDAENGNEIGRASCRERV